MDETNNALAKCNRMWRRLGHTFERLAYERAKSGLLLDVQAAVTIAKLAEGCFWQSTGEADCFDLPREKAE